MSCFSLSQIWDPPAKHYGCQGGLACGEEGDFSKAAIHLQTSTGNIKESAFQAKGGSSGRSSARVRSQAGLLGLYLRRQVRKLEDSMTFRERGLKSNSWLMKGRIKRSFKGYERLYQWIFQRCQAAFKISFRWSLQNGWSVAMDNLPRIGLEWFKT